jgi:signal transduction histidine kinase
MALSLESFDVRGMLDELRDTVDPLVQKNKNVLKMQCSDEVRTMHADLMKTRQILLNLLSNASKFTHDGDITLTVRYRIIAAKLFVEFTVTDRRGHDEDPVGKDFRGVYSGGRHDDTQVRRHRSGARHRVALL